MENIFKEENVGKFLFFIALAYLLITTYIGLTKVGAWSDEIYSIALASIPFNDFLDFALNDVHQILYYLIFRFFVLVFSIFNYTDIAGIGKFVSLFPFYLLIILSFFKVRKNFGLLTFGIFCLLISSMPQMMLYSVEIRMYSWGLFFVTASFIYCYEIIYCESNLKNWAILTILTICSCYTHYFALLASVSIYLILFIHLIKTDKSHIKNWIFFINHCCFILFAVDSYFIVSIIKSQWILD